MKKQKNLQIGHPWLLFSLLESSFFLKSSMPKKAIGWYGWVSFLSSLNFNLKRVFSCQNLHFSTMCMAFVLLYIVMMHLSHNYRRCLRGHSFYYFLFCQQYSHIYRTDYRKLLWNDTMAEQGPYRYLIFNYIYLNLLR